MKATWLPIQGGRGLYATWSSPSADPTGTAQAGQTAPCVRAPAGGVPDAKTDLFAPDPAMYQATLRVPVGATG